MCTDYTALMSYPLSLIYIIIEVLSTLNRIITSQGGSALLVQGVDPLWVLKKRVFSSIFGQKLNY